MGGKWNLFQAYTSDLKSTTVNKTWTSSRMFEYSITLKPGPTTGILSSQAPDFAMFGRVFPFDLNENEIRKTAQEYEQSPTTDECCSDKINVYILAKGYFDGVDSFSVFLRLNQSTAAALYPN